MPYGAKTLVEHWRKRADILRMMHKKAWDEIRRLRQKMDDMKSTMGARIAELEEACRTRPEITAAACEIIAEKRSRLRDHSSPADWHLSSTLIAVAENALEELRKTDIGKKQGEQFATVQDAFDDDIRFDETHQPLYEAGYRGHRLREVPGKVQKGMGLPNLPGVSSIFEPE